MLATMGGVKCYHAVTGKTVGAPGSLAHITSNDNLSTKAKLSVLAEQGKEGLKDTFSLAGATATVAAAGSLAVANSNKCADAFKTLISKAGDALSKVEINGNNLKEAVKNTDLYNKVKSLPLGAKAAIAAGTVALAVLAPLYTAVAQSKAGYIEGKYEGQ